jgi:hypothetical protein
MLAMKLVPLLPIRSTFAREGVVRGGNAEEGSEGSVPGAPAVAPEDEFIEVGLEVLAAQPVVDAQDPNLEVGEDPANPRQDDHR